MLRVMRRKASDNKYLHRDFHVSADVGLAYVGEHFGDDAVVEYLSRYAEAHYAPLVARAQSRGLAALADYFSELFKTEEAESALALNLSEDRLRVEITACPAVTFMRSSGHIPSRWYKETTVTLYRVLAEMLKLHFSLECYDEETGATAFTFTKPEVTL